MRPRLNTKHLADVAMQVRRPGYQRDTLRSGVIHIGPGAFHRAHQAAYFEDLLARDPRWSISAISLRTSGLREALAPQDMLYTLVELGPETATRIIGAVSSIDVAAEDMNRALDRFASPHTHVVTMTVTEKGYCLDADGALDFSADDIRADQNTPRTPRSAIGFLVEGLRRRKQAGLGAITVLSCDNLADNGDKLRAAVAAYAAETTPELAAWIEDEVAFPRTMVDAITPTTDECLRMTVRETIGAVDAWPVQREFFSSWIIENDVKTPFPDLESVGARITADVDAHAQAKLRLLNGAHSSLAYLGLARGRSTVAEAMRDPVIARFIRRLMKEELAVSISPPQGLDIDAYAEELIARFENPAIAHATAQIAMDGSQKLPVRLIGAIADNLAHGRPIALMATGVAAWMRHIRRSARDVRPIDDPKAKLLNDIGLQCRDDAKYDVALILARSKILPALLADAPPVLAALEDGYARVMALEAKTASAV